MVATIDGKRVYVRLSRRNLRQLNAILEDPNAQYRWLARTDRAGTSIVVQVEDDEDHYAGRNPGAILGVA